MNKNSAKLQNKLNKKEFRSQSAHSLRLWADKPILIASLDILETINCFKRNIIQFYHNFLDETEPFIMDTHF